jgi:RimJ/RimL family protein N-acetyltransferase/heme-degrading monooxygenase HmoA
VTGFTTVWAFEARSGREAEFERLYGAEGAWAELFRRAPGYIETRLIPDASARRRYVSVDKWASEQHFRAFRSRFAREYEKLDKACASLATGERLVASFGGEALIETERLRLRLFTLEDAAFVRELVNAPLFLRFIGDKRVRTLEDARQYLRSGPIESYARHGFGMYLVSRRDDGTPIGMCGLLKREALKDADVGFAYLPAFHSHGYGFEAASAVLAYARHVLGLTRIAAIVKPDNEASIALIEKLGLRLEGTTRIADFGPEDKLFGREL